MESSRRTILVLSVLMTVSACGKKDTPDGNTDPTIDSATPDSSAPIGVSSLFGECGFSRGFGAPMDLNAIRPGGLYDYYASRSFYYDGVHLAADLDGNEGDRVRAGVNGKIVKYSSASGYGTLVAVVAVDVAPSFEWDNAHDTPVSTDRYLAISGHIRPTSDYNGGSHSGVALGDCVGPDTTLGWLQRDGPEGNDPNGDGDVHLHYGVRLQSKEDAERDSPGYWYAGYDSAGQWGEYYTDPTELIDRTVDIEPWATDAVDSLHAAGILVEDSDGYKDRMTWNRAEIASMMAKVIQLQSSVPDIYEACACPFDDVIVQDDDFAHDVCTLTWLTFGDGVSPFRNESDQLIPFRPGYLSTRAEFLKILVETLDLAKSYSGARFTDMDDAPPDLQVYIHSGVSSGIVNDNPATNPEFRPDDVITLGEIAVLLDGALSIVSIPAISEASFSTDPNSQCTGNF